MKISKTQREIIRMKYGGRCAYCGCELSKGFHVDHIQPAFHNWTDEEMERILKTKRGSNSMDNYNPSCPRCNRWKATFNIEQFREEISKQLERLRRDSPQFRMASDYGMINENKSDVKFYFEKYETK